MPTPNHSQLLQGSVLQKLFSDNRSDKIQGIYSICSAHSLVLEAAFETARDRNSLLLIEATSNQVNHQGGYTGMQPADFYKYSLEIAQKVNFPLQNLILGGDHLGPNPWRQLPAQQAMQEAEKMVSAYVKAGFKKIHLDASMACADDLEPLTDEIIAQRAAQLCKIAEKAAQEVGTEPLYVIGTEVPVPGGEINQNENSDLADRIVVTDPDAVYQTITTHHNIFAENNLKNVWSRVIAIVTQPGVDFDDQHVLDYQPHKAAALSKAILTTDHLVFEAHSTDYQTEKSLHNLVKDHFAILKVGPELTFALREALFALSYIEDELYNNSQERSQLRHIIESVMLEQPNYWQAYYQGSQKEQKLARQFSYSDRMRYYWLHPEIDSAVQKLIHNIRNRAPAETLLSQWLPEVYYAFRNQEIDYDPLTWIKFKISCVIKKYAQACMM